MTEQQPSSEQKPASADDGAGHAENANRSIGAERDRLDWLENRQRTTRAQRAERLLFLSAIVLAALVCIAAVVFSLRHFIR